MGRLQHKLRKKCLDTTIIIVFGCATKPSWVHTCLKLRRHLADTASMCVHTPCTISPRRVHVFSVRTRFHRRGTVAMVCWHSEPLSNELQASVEQPSGLRLPFDTRTTSLACFQQKNRLVSNETASKYYLLSFVTPIGVPALPATISAFAGKRRLLRRPRHGGRR